LFQSILKLESVGVQQCKEAQATANLYGGIAPCSNTTARPEIDGLTCPMTGTLPRPSIPTSLRVVPSTGP
jgi:hypothetical protein